MGESGLLVPQLMSQLVTLHELLYVLVYDCTDTCERVYVCLIHRYAYRLANER